MSTISVVIRFGAASPAFLSALARDLDATLVDLSAADAVIVADNRPLLGGLGRLRWLGASPRGIAHATRFLPFDARWDGAVADRGECHLVLGWAAAIALAGKSDVATLCFTAPRPVRLSRISRSSGLTDEEAARAIDVHDARMSAYTRASLGHDDGIPFDLVIDASRFDRHAYTSLVTECLKARLLSRARQPQIDQGQAGPSVDAPHGHVRHGRRYALVEHEHVDLSAVDTQEAAIAAIESRLHHACHHRRN